MNSTVVKERNSKLEEQPGFGRGGRLADKIFPKLTTFFALLIILLLIGMLIVLNIDAAPAIKKFGISFLSGTMWDAVREIFGALPAVYGTLLSSLIALIIAVPISLGAAVFLSELSPAWLKNPASLIIEMLAAIPSVIIGLWGLFVLVPMVRSWELGWLGKLDFLPLFQGPPFGIGFLSAGIILSIMIIPIITALSRDAIRAVPNQQREAMLALGATRWETIRRTVLPYCQSGLIGAAILGLGRALGETMAVTMVIGNGYKLTASLFSPGTTIASQIAGQFAEADSAMFKASLVELALVLFAVTLGVNIIARVLVWRFTTVKQTRE